MLVLVLGSLLGLLAERDARASLQNVIGRQLTREAGHTADRVAALIRSEILALESFSRQEVMRQIRVSDLDKTIAQALATLATGNDARVGYLALDDSKAIVASSNPTWLREAPEWLVPGGDDEIFFTAAEPADPASRLVLTAAVEDPDRPGTRLGTLVGILDWHRLTDVIDDVRGELSDQGIAAEIVIMDDHASILRRSTSIDGSRFSETTLERVARESIDSPNHHVNDETNLIAGRANVFLDHDRWTLFVIEPLSHALAPALRLRDRLALTTVAVLAIALFVAWIGARRVVHPLSELTEAIRKLSKGRSRGTLVPVRSEDEIGTLAAAFNKMTSELDETQRHLIEAEKFAFVGELAAGVAHEVRTSLGVLRSSAQIIERSLASTSDEHVREMIGMISAEVERLSHVVDDLLNLDHKRPLDFEATPLSEPILAAIRFVRSQAEEAGIELVEDLASKDPVVRCDREAIQQVCVNLLSNAIASLESGDRIEVSVSEARDGRATFAVRDNGRGVPADLAERIFDPFVTGRASGVGLGLTTVKRVVHDHDGSVRLVPKADMGACFEVELPTWENAR